MKIFSSKFTIIFLYFFMAILFTYPLIFHFNNSIPGSPLDGFNYMWNVDTFWHQLFKFKNPFFTDRIFFPMGTNLVMHNYSSLTSFLGFPFLKNLVLYMNLLIFVGLVCSSLTMFALIKYITKNKVAAFISGLFYGFSPIMVSYILSQHYYYVIAAPFLPLGILTSIRFFETFRVRYLIILVAIFWAIFLTDYYPTILLILLVGFTSLIFIFHDILRGLKSAVSPKRECRNSVQFITGLKVRSFLECCYKSNSNSLLNKREIMQYLLVITIGLVIPSFLIFGSISKLNNFGSWALSKSYYPNFCSAKTLGFLIPSETNPFLKGAAGFLYDKFSVEKNFDTPYYFLGWFTLALAVFSAVKLKKDTYTSVFSISGIIIFWLTLGPKAHLFNLFSKIPFMGLIDCPQRFIVGAQISIAGLIGLLVNKSSNLKKPFSKRNIAFAFILLFLIEYGSWNLPLSKVETPLVYQQLADRSDEHTILELPSGISESKGAFGYDWSIQGLHLKQLYWQTLHKKPRVGGYVSRLDPNIYDFYKNEPIISDLFNMTSLDGIWSGKEYSKEEVANFIGKFNLGYIILSPNGRQLYFKEIVEALFSGFITQKIESQEFIIYFLSTPELLPNHQSLE